MFRIIKSEFLRKTREYSYKSSINVIKQNRDTITNPKKISYNTNNHSVILHNNCVTVYKKDKTLNYKKLMNLYDTTNSWGLVTTIDCKNCNPETIRNENLIRQYVKELCSIIDMKRFGDTTVVHFGEDEKVEGYSMVQLIETSLISGHFANSTNNVYIDIFSCKPYNPYQAIEFTKHFFESQQEHFNILLR